MLWSRDPVAQTLEKQQAEEEQQHQSITEIMKNPGKVILLKVSANEIFSNTSHNTWVKHQNDPICNIL